MIFILRETIFFLDTTHTIFISQSALVAIVADDLIFSSASLSRSLWRGKGSIIALR